MSFQHFQILNFTYFTFFLNISLLVMLEVLKNFVDVTVNADTIMFVAKSTKEVNQRNYFQGVIPYKMRGMVDVTFWSQKFLRPV